ncbi:cysteine hydrolase family protein [Desulfoluna spongiiphila]|uniref:Nicotinamidase-related amidase n=1 Tax=Desulfoluna spongiiphila TaxID=419481 RepID=A0A1G5IHL5_9BACT|nr:isochorismatase family cysteine hydrolase [Desulfoluna spongiiphila]SCY75566.1 Nicotinamidase-related amidase [Desulfoluna spongiiphila]
MLKNAALLVIDMQNDFVLPGAPVCVEGALETVPKIRRLLDWFRQARAPVFHVVREYRSDGSDVEANRRGYFLQVGGFVVPGTRGCEIVEGLGPVDGEYRLVKNRYSGFMQTELDMMLRRLGVTRLVVCGTQYPNCVRATIFDAVALGYGVTLVTDAASARTPEIAEANILDIGNIGVVCVDTETFLRP